MVKKRWNLNREFRYGQVELARDKYDLVNSSFVLDGLDKDRWLPYTRDLHDRLRPDGWVQMMEADFNIQSDNGSPLENLPRWWELYSQALAERNKEPRIGPKLAENMRIVGLTNVAHETKLLPIGDWHAGMCCPWYGYRRAVSFSFFLRILTCERRPYAPRDRQGHETSGA